MLRHLIPAVGALLLGAGVAAQSAGDSENEDLREARRSYELSEGRSPKDDKQLASATLNYGESLLREYRLAESRKMLKLALKRYEALYGKDSPELVPALLLLAQAEVSYPALRPNDRRLNRARKIAMDGLDNASTEFADQMLAIGQVSLYDPPPKVAGSEIQSAYQIYLTTLGPHAMKTGEAAFAMGRYLMARNGLDEAQPYLESALKIFDPSDAARRERHIAVRTFWGGTLDGRGMRDKATVHYVAIGSLLESDASDEMLPLLRAAPVYPPGALRFGISGYVDWRFTVDEKGFVVDPEVVEIQGSEEFRKASLRALMRFRYPPRFVDGAPVAQSGVTTRITFTIMD